MTRVAVGLIGDRSDTVVAHRAIPRALELASHRVDVEVRCEWVPTEEIVETARVAAFDALWCVPASPYRSMDGALRAIRYAREHEIPFLGTCGGFQHAVVEYARNVLGWTDAGHAESTPDAPRAVIWPLECALVEASSTIRFVAGSRIAAVYGAAEAFETYHCSYGVNPQFRAALTGGPLRVTGEDAAGDIRAVELDRHPFFVATLFQPERGALNGRPVLLADALVRAALARR